MKKDIHPKYYKDCKITCACGNVFTIGSTVETIETEICSQCHPFYTGKEKIIDTLGRVDKFRKRLAKKQEPKTKKKRESTVVEPEMEKKEENKKKETKQ